MTSVDKKANIYRFPIKFTIKTVELKENELNFSVVVSRKDIEVIALRD